MRLSRLFYSALLTLNKRGGALGAAEGARSGKSLVLIREITLRIGDSMLTGSSLLVAAMMFLIAWKAGDQPGNLIALALAFGGANSIAWILLKQLHASELIRQAVNLPTFVLGAGFFVLAAARFPRKLTPTDIASSSTIWGKIRLLRAVTIFFLAPAAVWALVAIPAVAMEFIESGIAFSVYWFVIVLLALVYFYINYRSRDAETQKKVLWFFELTVCEKSSPAWRPRCSA